MEFSSKVHNIRPLYAMVREMAGLSRQGAHQNPNSRTNETDREANSGREQSGYLSDLMDYMRKSAEKSYLLRLVQEFKPFNSFQKKQEEELKYEQRPVPEPRPRARITPFVR